MKRGFEKDRFPAWEDEDVICIILQCFETLTWGKHFCSNFLSNNNDLVHQRIINSTTVGI
jgi:hypothetical protein